MKQKLFFLFLFYLCLFSCGLVRASNLSLLGKVIYIDVGHGGKDPGAIVGELKEADLNLQISFKLQKMLERQGAVVYLTRYGDYDLSSNNVSLRKRSDLTNRAKIINSSDCDMYISVHLNADTSNTWKGAQIFYNNKNTENEKIAKILQNQLKEDLNTDRDYKKLTNQYMYKLISVKGVLAEVGFITNPNERNLLKQKDYQYKIANSLTKGIIKYFSND